MSSVEADRARLAARLAHRLESSLLLAREAADRGDAALLAEQLDELGRRARGLARACTTGPDAGPVLRDAILEWMGADAAVEEQDGLLSVRAAPGREPPEAAELGEPLVRLLAGEAGGEVVSWEPRGAVIRL